jgi:hypothetical protein
VLAELTLLAVEYEYIIRVSRTKIAGKGILTVLLGLAGLKLLGRQYVLYY